MCKSLPTAGFGGGTATSGAALAQGGVGLDKILLI